jgi:chemotaxis response regulator CheB
MPKVICEAGLADKVLPIFEIPAAITKAVEKDLVNG